VQHQDEDLIAARIMEAQMALTPAAPYLDLPQDQLIAGARSQAEAFIANAPSLYGYERDTERLFMALDIAVSAIQADPTYGGGYSLAAACIYRLGVIDVDIYDPRALTAAIPWAHRAKVMDPGYDMGWEVYIELHCFKGDFSTAEQALGEVYRRFGDNDLYARTAFLYFRLQGEVAQALNWGALAWQTEWDEVRLVHTLFALGQLYRDVGEWRKAADAYRVITERDRENAWAFHYGARCAAELGDFNAALELNQNAIQLGNLHEFRAYQEDLRRAQGRARMGAGRVTTIPPTRQGSTRVVAAPPPAAGSVVPAPPAKGSTRVVAAPPPAKPSTRVVAAPPPAKPRTRVVKAPPPAPPKLVPPPPAVSQPNRPVKPPRKPPAK
jgi:tetratricopeptide (TPR) repeat protein